MTPSSPTSPTTPIIRPTGRFEDAAIDVADLRFERAPLTRPGDARSAGPAFTLSVPRLRIAPGERVAISGPSGSGKSTFLDLLALLRRPSSSQRFRLMGRDIMPLWSRSGETRSQLRATSIGYVLQTGGLLPYLDVERNLRLPQSLLDHADDDWIEHLLTTLGLQALRRRLPARLSLGERQRVAVARALAHRPALVLADEPTASLDSVNGERVLALLVSLCAEAASSLVLVSHDTGLLERHRLGVLRCTPTADGAVIA